MVDDVKGSYTFFFLQNEGGGVEVNFVEKKTNFLFKTLIVMFYVAVWEEAPHNDASSCLWECFRRLKNDGSEQFEQTGPRRDLLTCSRRMCRR